MISLTRIRTIAAIPKKYRGKYKKNADIRLLKAQRDFKLNPINEVKFDKNYWKAAKKQLILESNGKCAYCEADTTVVAHGDVEHYRPKSVYWWLAYTYDNYLYACQICNQVHKGDKFPVLGAMVLPEPVISANYTDTQIQLLAGMISPDPVDTGINFTLARHENEHKSELPALLNPYFDDPTLFFAYDADDILQEVTVVAASPTAQPYIDAAESCYGINRNELKTIRYKTFRYFRVLKRAYSSIADPNIQIEISDILKDMISDSFLFAGMNRYFDAKL